MNWPNRLSLLRVGLVPLIVLMICLGAPWSYGAALALFLAGSLTDWADGWMARSCWTCLPGRARWRWRL